MSFGKVIRYTEDNLPSWHPPTTGYNPIDDGADCMHCPMRRWAGPRWAPVPAQRCAGEPFGLILGEAPARNEEAKGIPFIGEAGRELDRGLAQINVPRWKWDIDNVIACRAPKNKYDLIAQRLKREKDKGLRPDYEKEQPAIYCRPRLMKSLERSSDVIPMGAKAASAILPGNPSILAIRGGPVDHPFNVIDSYGNTPVKNLRVLPTVHPSFVRRARRWREVYAADLRRAVRHFTGTLTWRDPGMYFDPTPEFLQWFFNQPSRYWTYDVETDRKDALTAQLRCIGFHRDPTPEERVQGQQALGHEIDDVGVNVTFWSLDRKAPYYDSARQPLIDNLLRRVFTDGRLWVGHNAGSYDRIVIENRLGVRPRPLADTIMLDHLVSSELPHSLGVLGSIHTDVTAWKQDNEGSKQAVSARNDRELGTYCLKDTGVTHRVFPILLAQARGMNYDQPCLARPSITMIQLEHRTQDACTQMQKVGMYVDQKARSEMEAELTAESNIMRRKMQDIAADLGWKGAFNPASVYQVRDLLYEVLDLDPVGFTDAGDPSTEDKFLRAHLADATLPEKAERAILGLRGFRIKDKARQFMPPLRPAPPGRWRSDFDDDDDEKGKVREDGRIHVNWNAHVPVTGRFSSSPNMQNQPKVTRKVFVAAPGHVLVGADAEQLEARILSARWGLQRYLEAFEQDMDTHQITMHLVHGDDIWGYEGAPPPEHRYHKRWPGGEISGHFARARDLLKRFYYACGMRGTPVVTLGPEGSKPIEDIDVGKDYTWTWDGEKYVPTKIIRKVCNGRRQCVRVTFKWRGRGGHYETDSVVFTLNHRFMLRDGSYREAGQLRPGDRLMPFRRGPSGAYRTVDTHNDGRRVLEHRAVKGFYERGQPHLVHHDDHNEQNNNPDNLIPLETTSTHARIHWKGNDARRARHQLWNREQWDDANREETNQRLTEGRVNSPKWQHAVRNCTEARSAGHKRSWASGKRKPRKQQASILDPYADIIGVLPDTVVAERADCTIQNVYHYRKKRGIPPVLRTHKKPNHTVVSVEDAGVQEVWDIEVDHPAHNFALASGIFVHNSTYGAEDPTKLDVIRSSTDKKGNLIYTHLRLEAVAAMTRAFLDNCPEMERGWETEAQFFHRHGYNMEPITGRRRYFKDGFDRNEIVNFPVQSSGAGIMNLALIDVLDAGFTAHYAGPGTGPIQQGHDSIVLEVPEHDAMRAKECLEAALTQYYPHIYNVHFYGEAAIGHSWYEV